MRLGMLPGISKDGTPREGFKGDLTDESTGISSHGDRHMFTTLDQRADDFRHLVRGNSTTDPDEDRWLFI